MKRGTAGACVVLGGRQSTQLTVRRWGVEVRGEQRFTQAGRVDLAVDLVLPMGRGMAVTLGGGDGVPRRFPIDFHLWFVGATGPPPVPHVIAFCTVLNQQKKPQCD